MDARNDQLKVSKKKVLLSVIPMLILYRVNSPEMLKALLPQLETAIKDPNLFKKLYLFTFGFAKTTGQKSMEVDVSFI